MISWSGINEQIGRQTSLLPGLFLCILLQALAQTECLAFPKDNEWERLSRESSRSEFDGDVNKAMLLIDQSLSATKTTASASDRARITLKKCRMLALQGRLAEAIAEANSATMFLSADRWQDRVISYQINRALAQWYLATKDSTGAVTAAQRAMALGDELNSDVSMEGNSAAIQLVEALLLAKRYKEVLELFQEKDGAFKREMQRVENSPDQVMLLTALGISQVALDQRETGYALLNRAIDISRKLSDSWIRNYVAQRVLQSGINLNHKNLFAKMTVLVDSLGTKNREALKPFLVRVL